MKETKDLNLDIILDNMTESMVVVDADGKVVFFNKIASTWERLDGRKPIRQGENIAQIDVPERSQLTTAIISRVRVTKITQSCEAEYKDRNGYPIYYEMVFNPILNDAHETEYICIVSRDITSQKTYEKKIVQLANEITRLIENANAVIFGVDSRGYIMEWNKESRRVTHFERNDVYTKKFVDLLLDPRHHEAFLQLFQRVLNGEPQSNFELSMAVKDGHPVSILLNATPKINSLGQVVGVLFVGQDVTELSEYRKLLEQKVKDRTEKLQEALQKEKELVEIKNRFVSIASHEFKVPLSSISASISLLKTSGEVAGNDALARLNNIEVQVTHMKALLEDVLTVGKGEVNKLKANIQPLDIVSFFHKIVEEMMMTTQQSHVIKMDCPDTPIQVATDEKLLRNIFINLLSNAIKFSPGKKEVFLTIEASHQDVKIVVKDSGIGIEKDDIEKIFDPFTRGSNAEGIKGTGLGLSIAKRAVETLGGSLFVESEVGNGTSFTVRLKKVIP
jgi:PAS domain S-box-containing protein